MKKIILGVILLSVICAYSDTPPYKICPKCGKVYQLEYQYCPVDGELLLQIGGYPTETTGNQTETPSPSVTQKSSEGTSKPSYTPSLSPSLSSTPGLNATPTAVILKSESGEELKLFPSNSSEEKGNCPANMVYIPSGSFNMGTKVFPYPKDAKLVHSIYVDGFCIDKYEYPNKLFSMPESDLSYIEASQKCIEEGKRLCTEAEWEKACKGPQFFEYPYGKRYDISDCRIDKDKMDGPTMSGEMTKCVSSYGVFDMSGNIAEWVYDYYDENFYYSSPASNPKGPESGDMRILKGGSFEDFGMRTKCSYREPRKPDQTSKRTGFRCCKNPN
jgi:formylglycine-generating enzyme required for sulfatase activity